MAQHPRKISMDAPSPRPRVGSKLPGFGGRSRTWSENLGDGGSSLFRKMCSCGAKPKAPHTGPKVEPKVFFANERTFLSWLHMSVTLASAALAILAFSKGQGGFAQVYGLLLLPMSIIFCAYALHTFQWRRKKIQERDPGPYDDGFGPVLLAGMLIVTLTINFFLQIYEVFA
jgi:uncharacterized membrane protein YidH (DUF202 family)